MPRLYIAFMCTYNALSVTSFTDFLKTIYKKRKELIIDENHNDYPQLMVSIPYLRHPEFLSIKMLDDSFEKYIAESVSYMRNHLEDDQTSGFVGSEMEMMSRILNWFQVKNNVPIDRIDFVKYVNEYDRRKGTNFLKTFPEYVKFYERCKELC